MDTPLTSRYRTFPFLQKTPLYPIPQHLPEVTNDMISIYVDDFLPVFEPDLTLWMGTDSMYSLCLAWFATVPIHPGEIHPCIYISSLFSFTAVYYSMMRTHVFYFHFLADAHLGCFRSLPIGNKTTMNIICAACFQVDIYPGMVAEWYSWHMFNFSKSCQTSPKIFSSLFKAEKINLHLVTVRVLNGL